MSKMISTVSPHFHKPRTTRTIMLDVIIALAPAMIASVIFFGLRSLAVIADCVAVCVVSEWGFQKLCKKDSTVDDLSAVVTGIILALNLPVTIPLWQAALGSVIAIVVVTQLFGVFRNYDELGCSQGGRYAARRHNKRHSACYDG